VTQLPRFLRSRMMPSTMLFPRHPDVLKLAPCSHIVFSCVRPSGATKVTSLRSSTTQLPIVCRISSLQVRSSSSIHGPANLPASFSVAMLEFRSIVIFSIAVLLVTATTVRFNQFVGRLETFQPPPKALMSCTLANALRLRICIAARLFSSAAVCAVVTSR
jgi:hypothetical protein